MNAKQQRFVAEYLIDLNATAAAERVGYHPKMAAQLLAKPSIKDAIERGKRKQLDKAELTAVRVLEELRRLSFSDVRSLFDADGNLKPIHTLTDAEAAAIASVEVVKKNLAAGDGKTDTVHKLKVWDKTRSLEMLAKHFGLLIERIDHSGAVKVSVQAPWLNNS